MICAAIMKVKGCLRKANHSYFGNGNEDASKTLGINH